MGRKESCTTARNNQSLSRELLGAISQIGLFLIKQLNVSHPKVQLGVLYIIKCQLNCVFIENNTLTVRNLNKKSPHSSLLAANAVHYFNVCFSQSKQIEHDQ